MRDISTAVADAPEATEGTADQYSVPLRDPSVPFKDHSLAMGIRLDFKRKGVATITWIDREPGSTPVSDFLVSQTPVAQMSPAELEGYKQGRIAEELVSQAGHGWQLPAPVRRASRAGVVYPADEVNFGTGIIGLFASCPLCTRETGTEIDAHALLRPEAFHAARKLGPKQQLDPHRKLYVINGLSYVRAKCYWQKARHVLPWLVMTVPQYEWVLSKTPEVKH